MKHNKVLFITWDGAEVTYVENLFGPIFLKLKEVFGYEFHIMQFTSAGSNKIKQRKIDLEKNGIYYNGLHVNKKFPVFGMLIAKFWNIRSVYRYIKSNQIDTLMPRSVNAFFITKGLVKKSNLRLVLDADGFPLDERVDFSGLSPLSWRYRFFRDVEFSGFHMAESVLCRSQKAKKVIVARAGSGFDSNKVFVINNGTFSNLKSPYPIKGDKSKLILIYSGSLGPQYMLDKMLSTFGLILRTYPYSQFKILTFKVKEAQAYILAHFPNLISSIEVKSVPALEVQTELNGAHIALSFRLSSFSMQSVAPIKIAEYLGAGLSIVYTPWTGDVDEILDGQPFAYKMDFKNSADVTLFLDWVKNQINCDFSQDARDFASKQFSLDRTADLYHKAIQYGASKG